MIVQPSWEAGTGCIHLLIALVSACKLGATLPGLGAGDGGVDGDLGDAQPPARLLLLPGGPLTIKHQIPARC